MHDLMANYHTAILCLGLSGALLIVQILVADVVAIKAKHPPGMPITHGHDSFIFRSARAAANTNETIAAFIACLLFCFLVGADAGWVNTLALLYIAARLGHMACYYLDWRLARSSIFSLTIIAILGLFGLGLASV